MLEQNILSQSTKRRTFNISFLEKAPVKALTPNHFSVGFRFIIYTKIVWPTFHYIQQCKRFTTIFCTFQVISHNQAP